MFLLVSGTTSTPSPLQQNPFSIPQFPTRWPDNRLSKRLLRHYPVFGFAPDDLVPTDSVANQTSTASKLSVVYITGRGGPRIAAPRRPALRAIVAFSINYGFGWSAKINGDVARITVTSSLCLFPLTSYPAIITTA